MSDTLLDPVVVELVADYARAAAQHGAATRAGNHNLANQSHDRLAKAYRELRARGPNAQRALLLLIKDNDPAVRLWAAAHSLEFEPETGSSVLSSLELGPPCPEQLAARYTLAEWRKGTLQFP